VKYHTNQAKQNNNNMRRASMATQEQQQRMGYQDFEVQKEQHRLKNNNARGATLLKE
jgi:hypothetical protein